MRFDALQDKAQLLLARARRGRPGGWLSGAGLRAKRRGAEIARIGARLAAGSKRFSAWTAGRLEILRHSAARPFARKPGVGDTVARLSKPLRLAGPARSTVGRAVATVAARASAGFAAALAGLRKAGGRERIVGATIRLRRQVGNAAGAIAGAAGRLKQRMGQRALQGPGEPPERQEESRRVAPPQGVPEAQRGAKPAWEAPVAAAAPAEIRFNPIEVLGLATRLGLVALVIAGGLAVILMNTPAGEAIGDRLKRTAPTGSVFDAPVATAAREGPPAAARAGTGGGGSPGPARTRDQTACSEDRHRKAAV